MTACRGERSMMGVSSATLPLLMMLLSSVCCQNDPLVNCRPTGSETSLCKDVKNLCLGFDLDYIYSPSTYCRSDQTAFFDPKYICNCNIICVDTQEEGDDCQSRHGSSYPTKMCGNGLDCLPNGNTGVYYCSRNPAKPCVKETIEYEAASSDGTVGPGQQYPQCDYQGRYGAVQCSVSSTCYCTNEEGLRLFGEALYTEAATMDCLCARHWERNDGLSLTEGMRCLPNGNLDPLQCNDDFCFCYNSTLNSITQGPYHPTMMNLLDCYSETYHKVNYTNPCHVAEERYLAENPENADSIVIGTSQKPNCNHDGYYAAVQPKGLGFYCSDRDGNQIGDFTFTASERDHSTCYCATRRHLMVEAGLTSFLPDCCPNGDFKQFQIRGLYAYCVDINGNQAGPAVPVTDSNSLPCAQSECLNSRR